VGGEGGSTALPGAEHAGYGLSFGVDVQLVVDIADMGADGADADTIFTGNLFIAETVDERVEDLVLPDGEAVIFDQGGRGCLKGLDDTAGQCWKSWALRQGTVHERPGRSHQGEFSSAGSRRRPPEWRRRSSRRRRKR